MFDTEGKRKYLTPSERKAFYDSIVGEPNEALRAFGLTLLNSGCRISEALNTIVSRIDPSSESIVFETLKRRKRGCYRAMPIREDLMASLILISKGKLGSDRLWDYSRSTAYRYIKSIMASAKISGPMATPKGLRHGFAVACLTKGIPLTTVKKWLGHARLETTAIYLDVSGAEERQLAKRLWSD